MLEFVDANKLFIINIMFGKKKIGRWHGLVQHKGNELDRFHQDKNG